LKHFKKANKDIKYKINVLDRNLSYERKKVRGLKGLSNRGMNLLRHESDQYYKKKDSALNMKKKREALEREIYRLENELNTHQKKREKLEKKNRNLKNIKAQKDKEIELIQKEIRMKDDDIGKSSAILSDLQHNIHQITENAMQY
jgi:chromosome segregation ATPase